MKQRRGRRLFLIGAALLIVTPLRAETIRWRMPTEYPATAMPGEAIKAFAAAAAARTNGALAIEPRYEAGKAFKAAKVVSALTAGEAEAADAFGGGLAETDPIFALSSLPFLTGSLAEAHRLADVASDAYRRALSARGLHLLYVVPWPASGIWSKAPLASADDLRGLAIRTYDATSTAVLDRAGAKAANLSFAEAMPKLKDGTFNAVLSSGDGGAGRRLWEVLSHFTAVDYAFPLSFGLVREDAYRALPDGVRAEVDRAAAETQGALWALVETRLAANYARMRENGVAIAAPPAPGLLAALKAAAAPSVEAWRTGTPGGAALLDTYGR